MPEALNGLPPQFQRGGGVDRRVTAVGAAGPTMARPVTGNGRSGSRGCAARQEGRRQAGRTIYADIFASTSCGSRNRYPRPHTVSMYSLPFEALASFLRILHIKTSMILMQKNDFRDAEAIAEAVQRPTMKLMRPCTVISSSTTCR